MKGTRLMEMVTWNPNIFDDILLPEGMLPTKQILLDQIMMDNYDLVCFIEEPVLFSQMVKRFFETRVQEFARLWHTYVVEYDPIENYNRKQDSWDKSRDEFDKMDSHTTTLGSKTTDTTDMTRSDNLREDRNLTETHDLTSVGTRTDNLQEEHTISAMNSSSYQPDSKVENTGTQKNVTTDTGTLKNTGDIKNTGDVKNKGTIVSENSGADTLTIKDDDENRHVGEFHDHTHGNIGVTTTQQMLQQERELNKWNIYEYISRLFAQVLLIRVYS